MEQPENIGSRKAESGKPWVSPKVILLPRLNELTLQSPVPGGGGTGGGGSTVVP